MKLNTLFYTVLAVTVSLSITSIGHATEDGPEFWTVNQPTSLYAQPATNALVLAKLPVSKAKFSNQGCVGTLNGDLWGQMTPAQQKVAEANVWCKIEFHDKTGWVQMMRLDGAD